MELNKKVRFIENCYKFNILMNFLSIIGLIIFIIKKVELTYLLGLITPFSITFFNILFLKKAINSIPLKQKDRYTQQYKRRL